MPYASANLKLDELLVPFAQLTDPRSTVNRLHPLATTLMIAIMGVLAGAAGPTQIALWAKEREGWLVTLFQLEHGVPRKDVFRRLLMALQPAVFQKCFEHWVQILKTAAAAQLPTDQQPVYAIDGKTLRRSHDNRNDLGALHCVSVWATDHGLSLGQVACDAKSNEITAIPEVLEFVDIKGAIITIDAMGTQKDIAQKIIAKGGDYVLALKGNQELLFQMVMAYIDAQQKTDFANCQVSRHTTNNKGHGRTEERVVVQFPIPDDLPGIEEWAGLKSIAMVKLTSATNDKTKEGKKTTTMTRYFISSLALDAVKLARAVRAHWSIENALHWSLDFTYREDESRIREDQMRQNFAWLNRFTLSLLKQHPRKTSLVGKRKACGWNTDFLLQVLTGIGT